MSAIKPVVRNVAKSVFRAVAGNSPVAIGRMSTRDQVLDAIAPLKIVPVEQELVRIGGDYDGGYLVPDDFAGITACFSPGVDQIASFEEAIVNRLDVPCYLADASVENPPVSNPRFDFEKKFVGTAKGELFMDFEDWVARKMGDDTTSDMLLQMDIEGAELDVLTHLSEATFNRFRIIVLELHALESLFARNSVGFLASFFRKLTKNHVVVHNHPNNCCGIETHMGISVPRVIEITLLRKDRATVKPGRVTIPNPLDMQNVRSKADITLPGEWY
ncbi:MAG: FkbM family methyltransferase [Sphingomonadaceae bacterium]